MSDSLMLEVTGIGKDRLVSALDLCCEEDITGVLQDGNKLCLVWEHDAKKRLSFPPSLMADVILEWLQRRPGSNPTYAAPTWPKEPDIDGHCKQGWRILYTNGKPIEIHPHWMVFHK